MCVLDPRMGLASTAAMLSLPRASRWYNAGDIGALCLSKDGRLAAAVGGGGVAVWDACGKWEARGLGWPKRWLQKTNRKLRAVLLGGRSVVAGGGARELLTFSIDGAYQGRVAEDGVRRAGVTCLVGVEGGFLCGRANGRVDFADVAAADGEWGTANGFLEKKAGYRRFWADVQTEVNWER